MLPKKLYNFNALFDGHPLAGLVEELTPPVLERATSDYRGAAMLGPVKLDYGMNGLSMDFTMAQDEEAVLNTWGVSDASGVNMRFLGARMADDGSASEAVEMSMRGRITKIDRGTYKPGEPAKTKVEMAMTYFKYSVNGVKKHEIDLISGVEIVNGVDRSADVLKALGLS